MCLMQEASKNASELLQAEEEEKKKAEKKRLKNKKVSHLHALGSSICMSITYTDFAYLKPIIIIIENLYEYSY